MEEKSANTVWHPAVVSRREREKNNNHRGMVIWFTGLSGSGKSTLAQAAEAKLSATGLHTYTLDGDNMRHGLCADLGFSNEDRVENIRRIGEVARLMVDAGIIVLAAFISPFQSDRQKVRNLVDPGTFFEVYCNCPLDICEQRDVKGLYRKARAGQIPHFTGISSPYEPPPTPELALDTGQEGVDHCVERIVTAIQPRLTL
ncbi:MAG: adenylyl-sulfate kinase [Magnetococcales bacterium]|nr:adenylyl-sulfate kinase [Magnetococcales bacterium]MBF0323365.1 adenylyl-sulfate kinase [Magnetococcales bacterium]